MADRDEKLREVAREVYDAAVNLNLAMAEASKWGLRIHIDTNTIRVLGHNDQTHVDVQVYNQMPR